MDLALHRLSLRDEQVTGVSYPGMVALAAPAEAGVTPILDHKSAREKQRQDNEHRKADQDERLGCRLEGGNIHGQARLRLGKDKVVQDAPAAPQSGTTSPKAPEIIIPA
jgi:hypothetical protein